MFLEALFTVVEDKNIPSAHCNIIQSKMREIIWDNMDGPGRHYAKWNKSDRKRQILNNFTYVQGSFKKANKI